MKLNWIKVDGLFTRFNHMIELKEDGLTIVHSPNGLGKSTLVKMVCLAFNGEWEELDAIPFRRLEFGFDEGMVLVFLKDEVMEVTLLDSGNIIPMTKDEVGDLHSVYYLGPQRLFIEESEGRYVSALDANSQRIAETYKEFISMAETIWVGSEDDELGDASFPDPHSKLHEVRARMTMAREAGLIPEMIDDSIVGELLDNEPTQWSEKQLKDLYRLSKVADALYPLAESAAALLDIINPMLFRKTLSLDSHEGFKVTLDEGKVIKVSKLSSGEKQLLLLLYAMMFEATPGGLVIIDEPEISLHITWQQCIASLFLSIGRARDLQIIMATHSPQVVHDRWDLTVELVV